MWLLALGIICCPVSGDANKGEKTPILYMELIQCHLDSSIPFCDGEISVENL